MPPPAKSKRKKKSPRLRKGVGAKCTILLSALHPMAIIEQKHPKGSRTNRERLTNCLMMDQTTRSIKGVLKLVIVVKHEDYGDDLIYCAERFAVVTSPGSEDNYFAPVAPTPADLPVWHGDGTDNSNEINDDIYHARNNAEDIANVRAKGFLVDNNNDPAPKNIPCATTATVKENGLPLDQEWGWDNTCNRQKEGHHHNDAKVKDHTKQDLIDLGFLEVFWLMFPQYFFYLVMVTHTSRALVADGHSKTTTGELTRFLGCIFFMACTSGFAKEDFWSTKLISILEGAVSFIFYSLTHSISLLTNFVPLLLLIAMATE